MQIQKIQFDGLNCALVFLLCFGVFRGGFHKETEQCSVFMPLHCFGSQTPLTFGFSVFVLCFGKFRLCLAMQSKFVNTRSHFQTPLGLIHVGQIFDLSLQCPEGFLFSYKMTDCAGAVWVPPTTGIQGATHRIGEPDKGTQGGPLATTSCRYG